jgi:hypothetical protein
MRLIALPDAYDVACVRGTVVDALQNYHHLPDLNLGKPPFVPKPTPEGSDTSVEVEFKLGKRRKSDHRALGCERPLCLPEGQEEIGCTRRPGNRGHHPIGLARNRTRRAWARMGGVELAVADNMILTAPPILNAVSLPLMAGTIPAFLEVGPFPSHVRQRSQIKS